MQLSRGFRLPPAAVMTRVTACVVLLCAALAGDVSAQRRHVSFEANPVHGTLGYGWHRTPERIVGLEVGFGFPQLDRTLVPGDEDLLDALHIGAFMRLQQGRSVTLDARLQVGLAELRGCSGCLLGALAAVSGGAFWGTRNVKIGTRLTAGVIDDFRNPAEFVLNLTPVALLVSHSW